MSPAIDRRLTLLILVILPVVTLLTGNNFYKSILVFGIINSIAGIGLCMMLGLAGQISLGQSAFFGLGAYATAVISNNYGVSPILAMGCGALLAMIVGWVISRPLSRLHDHYLAMATLAFAIVMYILFANLRSITGGIDPGINVKRLVVFGIDLSAVGDFFWFAWLWLLATVFIANNISSSKLGRSLQAMKMAPLAAASIGIDNLKAKAFVFAVGALFTGLAGGLYAYFARSFNASTFGIGYAIELLMMVVIGSLTRVSGAIVGAFIVTVLPLVFDQFEDYKTIVFGVAMVLIMKYMPTGLVDGIFSIFSRLRAKLSGVPDA